MHRAAINTTLTANKFKIVLPFLKATAKVGDGFFDVEIGNSLGERSTSYVLFGGRDLASRVSLDDASSWGSGGFVASSLMNSDFSGRSVSNAGDINGDTFDDLVIGVPYASRCYVMFGTKQGFVNMTEGFTIFGAQSSDLTGWSVSGAGDVNNDTYADIIIGAPRAAGSAGVSYVLFGKQFGFTDIYLEFQNAAGIVINGAAGGDCSGLSVSGAGIALMIRIFKSYLLILLLYRRCKWRWHRRLHNRNFEDQQPVHRRSLRAVRSLYHLNFVVN